MKFSKRTMDAITRKDINPVSLKWIVAAEKRRIISHRRRVFSRISKILIALGLIGIFGAAGISDNTNEPMHVWMIQLVIGIFLTFIGIIMTDLLYRIERHDTK